VLKIALSNLSDREEQVKTIFLQFLGSAPGCICIQNEKLNDLWEYQESDKKLIGIQ